MLLIEEPSVFILYKEMTDIATLLIGPLFLVGLILEYFSNYEFIEVVKKLFLITLFIGSFYHIHTKAVELSLTSASETLQRVSPDNIFQRRWTESRTSTKTDSSWGWARSFFVPNVNELIGTTLFVISQILLWVLKLIYSTVYHLTYVFSGITAVLLFMGWTRDALKGTIQASIWCILQPYVVVALLALVGNSINANTDSGGLAVTSLDSLIWLFGITILLLASPLMTYGMVKGEGIHSFGAKVGAMSAMGAQKMVMYSVLASKLLGNSYSYAKTGANLSKRTYRGGKKAFSGFKNSLQKAREAKGQAPVASSKYLSSKSLGEKSKVSPKMASHQRSANTVAHKYLSTKKLPSAEGLKRYVSPQNLGKNPENRETRMRQKDTALTAKRYLSPMGMNKQHPKTKTASAAKTITKPKTIKPNKTVKPIVRRPHNELR